MRHLRARRRPVLAAIAVVALMPTAGAIGTATAASADPSYPLITGDGSSWAGPAVEQWQQDVQGRGVGVDYNPSGSSTGRLDFARGLADFTVSEIGYHDAFIEDPVDAVLPAFEYSQFPVVAGGTAFMFNVPVDGSRLEHLRLSQRALAGIFSGQITEWDAPDIASTNPGIDLPHQQITVVVRSDGAGSTALLTSWMSQQFPADYAALCADHNCDPHEATSYFPTGGRDNFVAQSGSIGVTDYTASTPYTIDYDELAYAKGVEFPVARVQNAAGFWTTPRPGAVAVALSQARLTQVPSSSGHVQQDLSRVYTYGDPRSYPLSAYASMLTPADVEGDFTTATGATLAAFATHALCEGQQHVAALGYSPVPMSVALAGLDQVLRIPGVDAATSARIRQIEAGVRDGVDTCGNPAYEPGAGPAHNALVDTAEFPRRCDTACREPWQGDR